jgi:hypothetical protein
MKTQFAPNELPPLKKGDRRYLFDYSHEAIEFISGVESMNFLDDNHCMVLRLSTENQWAVDFEKINSPVLENPPVTQAEGGVHAR